jgi:hypothetical protein
LLLPPEDEEELDDDDDALDEHAARARNGRTTLAARANDNGVRENMPAT